MPKIDNANAPSFELHGATFTAIASPSRGAQETSMWRARVLPGREGVPHHLTREEIIVAVAGRGAVRIGDERHQLAPGDAFAIPAFVDFSIEAEGPAPFELLAVLPVGGRPVVAGQGEISPPWML